MRRGSDKLSATEGTCHFPAVGEQQVRRDARLETRIVLARASEAGAASVMPDDKGEGVTRSSPLSLYTAKKILMSH
jgi:hypothetical protein